MLRFDKATYLSLFFRFILSERLSNSLWELWESMLINIVSILIYNFIEFIILLYTFSVICFAWHKECIIRLISFSKFSDVLPTFTCAKAIGNLWSICVGLNSLSCLWSDTVESKTLATWSEILISPFSCFLNENISLSKALWIFWHPLGSIIVFLKVSTFFSFNCFFRFCRFFKNISIIF